MVKKSVKKVKNPPQEDLGKLMNLMTDVGFKRVFDNKVLTEESSKT